MTACFDMKLYTKDVIIKTAYSFIDRYFVHLDIVDNKYKIDIIAKDNESEEDIRNKLNNEIILQLARFTVSARTCEVRQLILGRAFASSITAEDKDIPEYNSEYVSSSEMILKDWFENNGN